MDRRAIQPIGVGFVDGGLVRRPERDVAGRVLVEQRVVEDRVERADSALAVDERKLAQPCPPVVLVEQCAQASGQRRVSVTKMPAAGTGLAASMSAMCTWGASAFFAPRAGGRRPRAQPGPPPDWS